jgi:hypothetical protein
MPVFSKCFDGLMAWVQKPSRRDQIQLDILKILQGSQETHLTILWQQEESRKLQKSVQEKLSTMEYRQSKVAQDMGELKPTCKSEKVCPTN